MPLETNLNWPLMKNNIPKEDLNEVIEYLSQDDPILTHSKQVLAFEQEWSAWLGVKYSVFVNSGASANLLTMTALKELFGPGEVIVPPLTWVSDIAAVLQNGLTPIFVDIDRSTLGMDINAVLASLNANTRAVFITHVLGYNALNQQLLDELNRRNIPLIEDVCESHGATFNGRKLGSYGLMSNFSFYYAHHMSTIEGGIICTNDHKIYEMIRMLRSHGMVREATSQDTKSPYYQEYPDLNRDFIFALPGYNVRPTEIGAVIGRAQLKRLDQNNKIRISNLNLFLKNLDPHKFQTDFTTEGSCNYAFTLVLIKPDEQLRDAVENLLRGHGVEFRRGLSGGGNQLRQPYLRKLFGDLYSDFTNVNHIHFFSWYIGNYPGLEPEKILQLCHLLNSL
jgi:CDP-6-deoxy-D-xylo-4-hexulose-3-dehydrase